MLKPVGCGKEVDKRMISHVLSAAQFSRGELDELFDRADWFRSLGDRKQNFPHELNEKTVALLFYEPSTRTRMSFELAAKYLGATVVGTEAAGMFSSAAKGETIEDTVRVLTEYLVDAIVIRHKQRGASHDAAGVSTIPIINAGDGDGEHPTQALLDLYTILRMVKRDREMTITFCGDIEHSRTVRSLCRLLIRYSSGTHNLCRLILCSPRTIRLGEDIRQELVIAGIPFEEMSLLPRAMKQCDVFYQTRVQMERFGIGPDGQPTPEAREVHRLVQERFRLDNRTARFLPPHAVVLHPLPRVGEIAPEFDTDPRAHYFQQAGNGLYIRMALLSTLLHSDG